MKFQIKYDLTVITNILIYITMIINSKFDKFQECVVFLYSHVLEMAS